MSGRAGSDERDQFAQLKYQKNFKDLTAPQQSLINDFWDSFQLDYSDQDIENEVWVKDLLSMTEAAPPASPVAQPAPRAQFQVPGGPGGAGAAATPAPAPAFSPSSSSLSLVPEPAGCAADVQNYVQQYVTTLDAVVSKNKKEVQSLSAYLEALKELRQKLTQEKAVQCEQLKNVYDQAVNARAPKPFVDMVKKIVEESTNLSALKDQLNATEWAQHDNRLMQTLSAVPLPGVRKRGREVDVEDVDDEDVEFVSTGRQVKVVTSDQLVDLSDVASDDEVEQVKPRVVIKQEPGTIKQEPGISSRSRASNKRPKSLNLRTTRKGRRKSGVSELKPLTAPDSRSWPLSRWSMATTKWKR